MAETFRIKHLMMALVIICVLPIAVVFFGIIVGAFFAATADDVNLRPNFFRRKSWKKTRQ